MIAADSGLQLANIPTELSGLPNWVVWKTVQRKGNPTKVPFNAETKNEAKSNDKKTWTTFYKARSVFEAGGFEGVGFMFDAESFVGIDLDGCRNPDTGAIAPWAVKIIKTIDSYTEVSPSRTGVKIWAFGSSPFDTGKNKKVDATKTAESKEPGIEIYDRKRYFAATGWTVSGFGSIKPVSNESLIEIWDSVPKKQNRKQTGNQLSVEERAARYLEKCEPAISGQGGHNTTFKTACKLILGFCLTPEQALPLFQVWNQSCEPPWDDSELFRKLNEANKEPGKRGFLLNSNNGQQKEAFRPASKKKEVPQEILEKKDDPHRLAKINLSRYRIRTNGELVFWRSDFWKYKAGQYRLIDSSELKAKITNSVREQFERDWQGEYEDYLTNKGKEEEPVIKKVTTKLVNDVIAATASMVTLPNSIGFRTWLPDRSKPDYLCFENGILDLNSLIEGGENSLSPHSPSWFDCVKLGYPFDTNADCRLWLSSLRQWFDNDREQIKALQKWFGYCLTRQTHLQKILFVVGPTRSGKGTILRILTAMLGEENTCSPTLSSLAEQFGLEPMTGKKLATITDARLSGRADTSVVVERLLSISGEDRITVPIKHKPAITTKLETRIVIVSNELPRMADASAALANRMLCLETPKSFLGKEDHKLTDRLLEELPGILYWAILGLVELNHEKKINQPQVGFDLVEELTQLASPVSSFVKECCELRKDGATLGDELYKCFRHWSMTNGTKNPITSPVFGRDLNAAVQGLGRIRQGHGGKVLSYGGIVLKDYWRQQILDPYFG